MALTYSTNPLDGGTALDTDNIQLSIFRGGGFFGGPPFYTSLTVSIDGAPDVLVATPDGFGILPTAFEPGWDGPGSSDTEPDNFERRIIIDANPLLVGSMFTFTAHGINDYYGEGPEDFSFSFTIGAAELSVLTPDFEIEDDGGTVVNVQLDPLSVPDGDYTVYLSLGMTPDLVTVPPDPPCYAGQGKGNLVKFYKGRARLALPAKVVGGPYRLILHQDSPLVDLATIPMVLVRNRNIRESIFVARRNLPPKIFAGPRFPGDQEVP